MSKKKKEHIKTIINKKTIDKAPADFTSKVMQDVFLLTNEESLKDEKLTSLLKQTIVEIPSDEFVSNIISQVETIKKIEFEPLISKRGWYLIWSVIITFVLFVIFSDASVSSNSVLNKITPYLNNAENLIESVLSSSIKSMKLSPLFIISSLCFSVLLVLDTFIKEKKFN